MTNIYLMDKMLYALNEIRISIAVVNVALSGTERDVTMLYMSGSISSLPINYKLFALCHRTVTI